MYFRDEALEDPCQKKSHLNLLTHPFNSRLLPFGHPYLIIISLVEVQNTDSNYKKCNSNVMYTSYMFSFCYAVKHVTSLILKSTALRDFPLHHLLNYSRPARNATTGLI